MKLFYYFTILAIACSSCSKNSNFNEEELTTLNFKIQEVDFDLSEDGFNAKSLDGPNGETVSAQDFYFYVFPNGSTDFSKCIEAKPGENIIALANKSYDIYASTLQYTSSSHISTPPLTFPTTDSKGEYYKGSFLKKTIATGENTITVPVTLQVFYLKIVFSNSEGHVLESFPTGCYVSIQQGSSEPIFCENYGEISDVNNPVYGIVGTDISLKFYSGRKENHATNTLIKSTTITPAAGKKYNIQVNAKSSTSGGISIDSTWDGTETDINF